MDYLNETTIAVISTTLVVLTQLATVIGKPKIITAVGFLSWGWDRLTGNCGKAKNKE